MKFDEYIKYLFVFDELEESDKKNKRNTQAADHKDAEREREKPSSSAAGDRQGRG
jgi:hypothetical protein